jgi:MYXO-CTERM domain-containing protein
VRAGGRAAVVGLAELLEEGRRAGLLTPWQREIAEAMLRRMTTGGFDLLRQALAALEESVMRRILVLKAAIVHRHPSSLIGFASEIGHLQEETLRARHTAATEGAAVAGARAAFEPGALRRFHDPVTALGEGASAWDGVPEGEAWPVPRWLRGIPREPLELSIVAFDQALTGDLDPEEPTGDGASDALTRALVLHGEAHAALARWQLALCAKADSREGLLRAMDAMRRAGAGALALLAGLLVLSAGAPGAAEASAPAAQLVVAMDIDAGAVSNLAAPDSQASVHPGAEEICDGIDTDCDGLELDADVDADGDGWFACNGDCDDSNSLIHPGRPETCGDSWDYDCDGVEAMGVDDPDCWARPQTEGAGSAGAGCARSESLGCAPERPEPPPPLFAALSAAALLLRRDERRRRPRVGIPAPDADPALDPESGEREAQRH